MLLAFSASASWPKEIRLPLSVEPAVIRDALVRQLFTGRDQRAVFWGEPGDCSFFYLEDPKVEGEVDRLRVTAHGEGRIGTEIGDACLSPIVWSGFLEVFERPRIEGWQLHFVVVDSNLYDERHEKSLLVGKLWDQIKETVQPRFAAVVIDLAPAFRELRDFLPTVASASQAAGLRRALDTLHLVSARALPRGVVVEAGFDVAEVPAAPRPSATEAPLSEAEVNAFVERANQWDAFLTFVIKTLGARTLSAPTRDALLQTLIDARYQIVDALEQPSRGQDPVRQLFVKSWERLRPVADNVARELPGAEAAQVLTFVAAGDALSALDQAGPAIGIEVSADGLRRMARMIAPGATADPLELTPMVDPKLRQLFGFGSPPEERPTPVPEPASWWRLPPQSAFAAEGDHARDWRDWVIDDRAPLDGYLKRVRNLLASIAADLIHREKLSPARAQMFRKLLPATAWQETCWRQFETRDGKVKYIRSRRASVGMLQVNERVWRGFYDIEKLRWRVAYNVQAGSELLFHYLELVDAERADQKSMPTAAELARAVYAAYNGGPGQLRQYLDPLRRGKSLTRVIDQLFGTKFDASGEGVETQVASCLTGQSSS